MSEHEQQVRELAYRLWEEAGYPDGRSDEFWYVAIEQIAASPAGVAGPDAPPAAVTPGSPPEAGSAPAAPPEPVTITPEPPEPISPPPAVAIDPAASQDIGAPVRKPLPAGKAARPAAKV